MREWLYVLLPITVILYFVVYPDQFGMLMNWAANFVG